MPTANPEKIKAVKDVSRPEIVFALARVPRSGRLFFGGSDFKVYEVDFDDEKPAPKELGAHESYVTGLTLAGPTLISGGYDGRLIWWDAESRSQLRSVPAHSRWVRGVTSSPDGRIVASVADDMVCRLWEAPGGRLMHELRGHDEKTPHHYPSMLYACAISPDGRHVATGDKVGRIVVWEIETGRRTATLEAPMMYTWDPTARRHSIGGIRSLAFSPDGSRLAVGGMGPVGNIDHLEGKTRVEVFDWQKGERTHEFPGDSTKGLIEHLEFHPNGDWLLAAGGANDGYLLFFDLAAKKMIAHEKMPMHVHDVALSEDAETVYAVGDKKIAVLKMSS